MADAPGSTRRSTLRTRQQLQRRADAFVRDNRFTIAVVFPVVGAILLVASAEGLLPGPLAFNPYLLLFGTAVMRLPLLVGAAPLIDRRAGVALVGLIAYTYAIEIVGVATGWPYGSFVYHVDLGPMAAGVPLSLPLFFVPLVLNSVLVVTLLASRWSLPRRLLVAVGVVIAVDLALDPGAVALGFWSYTDGGVYYGVPVSNYLGWVLSGSVAVGAITAGFAAEPLRERLEECEFMLDDFVSFVLLWGTINAFYGNWIAVGVVLVLAALLVRSDRFEVPAPPWWPDRSSRG
jgi:putative membrane protein